MKAFTLSEKIGVKVKAVIPTSVEVVKQSARSSPIAPFITEITCSHETEAFLLSLRIVSSGKQCKKSLGR